MFERWVEGGLLDVLGERGVGCIPFSPLAQGLLTDRYLHGIPDDSRAAKPHGFLKREQVTARTLAKVRKLNELAAAPRPIARPNGLRPGCSRDPRVTTVLIGASSVASSIRTSPASGMCRSATTNRRRSTRFCEAAECRDADASQRCSRIARCCARRL